MTRYYWLALRWTLVAWLLIVLTGAILLIMCDAKRSEAEGTLLDLSQQLSKARQRAQLYRQYQQDAAVYLTYQTRWQQSGKGNTGNSNQWLATWHDMQQQYALPHMQYEFQPASTCSGVKCATFIPGIGQDAATLSVTPVKLRWTVTHEADVLNWLQQLQQLYAGMLLVHGCTWSMAESGVAISAECDTAWFEFPRLQSDQSPRAS